MEVAAMLASHAGLHADLRRYLELMFKLAADTLDAYASAKRQIGALDFTDQERLLLDVLDHPFVASTLGEELDLLMVDEFQDTSPIQLALFLKLARYARQVVWVGDIKQAIYGFRGSDTALMRSVIEALPKLGGTKEVLAAFLAVAAGLGEVREPCLRDAVRGLGGERGDAVCEAAGDSRGGRGGGLVARRRQRRKPPPGPCGRHPAPAGFGRPGHGREERTACALCVRPTSPSSCAPTTR